jgi:acetyltransferase-like isoleucine patch superfamily enzyme
MTATPGFLDAYQRVQRRGKECAELLGAGLSLPDLTDLDAYNVIHTETPGGAPMGKANFILVHKSTTIGKMVRFKFVGTHNVVVIGQEVDLGSMSISCFGKFGIVIIGDNCGFKTTRIALKHRAGSAVIGRGMSWVGGSIVVSEDDNQVVIGDDCLFSWDIEIMPTDGHPIYDRKTGERINPAKPIFIGPRTWVGRGASISKGVRIARGSIIGQGSLVTKNTEEFCAYGGVPAKLLRRDVEWRRSFKEPFVPTED